MTFHKSPLFPIFLIIFVDVLGLTIIFPLLPIYAEQLGATPFIASLLVSIYATCQLISSPILGHLSDRVGRKPLLLVSQMGTLAGFLILATANKLWVIFLSRIIDGITAGNISVAAAYISDVSDPQSRTKSFGVIGVAFGLGFLVGPATAGFLVTFGHQAPIFAAAGLSLLSIISTATLLPSSRKTSTQNGSGHSENAVPSPTPLKQLTKNPTLTVLLTQFLLFIFPFAMFMSGFSLFSERRFSVEGAPFGVKQIGYVLAWMGLVGVLTQIFVLGRLVKRLGERALMKFGFGLMTAGFFILGVGREMPILMASVTLAGFGSSLVRPSITSLITQTVGRDQQGAILGLMQSVMSVAQILAPMAGGLMIEHQVLSGWAWAASALSAGGLSIGLFRTNHPSSQT